LTNAATELMHLIVPIAELLTKMPASPQHPGQTAGMSFAMLRNVARVPHGAGEWRLWSERLGEVADATAKFSNLGAPLAEAAVIATLKTKFDVEAARAQREDAARIESVRAEEKVNERPQAESVSRLDGECETVHGRLLILKFDAKRCIHSRFCVLGLPHVYKANVQGAWIDPDAASVEANIGVAHNFPSGAIAYERKDGGTADSEPKVNLVTLRENGPCAFRAPLVIDNGFIGFRATLCRCGASKNKPFCDGSHHQISFAATGEPATGTFDALAVRHGTLENRPQRNGPLAISGNLEIVSGTGRTVMKTTSTRLCRWAIRKTSPTATARTPRSASKAKA